MLSVSVFRRKLPRDGLLPFLAAQPRCVVAMEACATAHGWGREIEKLGHTVRLIAPIYVKPFVKRHKNDAADAEAITEAASRPTMRFVAVKTEVQQARAMLLPDPRPAGAPADAADQCASRPSRRVRRGGAAGAGPPEAAGGRHCG